MSNRKRQRLFRYAVDLFIDLLQQVTKRKVNYRCNDADVASWNHFMDKYGDRIGEEFVRKFAQYGIQSWFNDGTDVDYSRSVRFNWIFGKSAIERWNKFDIATNVHITRIGLKTNNNINTIKRKTSIPELVLSIRPVEEEFKEKYHNQNRGFVWCIANTTLYHHKSSLCVQCIYKTECKKLLKQEYPKIYLKRGYGQR